MYGLRIAQQEKQLYKTQIWQRKVNETLEKIFGKGSTEAEKWSISDKKRPAIGDDKSGERNAESL